MKHHTCNKLHNTKYLTFRYLTFYVMVCLIMFNWILNAVIAVVTTNNNYFSYYKNYLQGYHSALCLLPVSGYIHTLQVHIKLICLL